MFTIKEYLINDNVLSGYDALKDAMSYYGSTNNILLHQNSSAQV